MMMKPLKRLSLLVMLCVATSIQAQQDPFWLIHRLGHWWLGVIEEASLPINLTFGVADGELKPFLYSPMQSSEPMIATKWSLDGDTLRINHKETGVRLTLVWNAADSTFDGTFRQGMLRTKLHLEPTDSLFRLVRPQTPRPPFPYSEQEVTIVRKKASVTLAGTLTIPEGEGPFPAVVLISGSGQQNRDEELMGHKPFLVLADWLTRQGIAVLRYDDRGMGGSKGEVTNATSFDFADDAEAVIDWLRHHPMVDKRHVGLLGHSEGAMIASVVASRNRHVDFVVFLAGPGTSGADILLQQNTRIMQLNGVPPMLNDRHTEFLRQVFLRIDTLSPDRYQEAFVALCDSVAMGLSADERKQASLRKSDAVALALQLKNPWFKTFLSFDNSIYLKRMRCPLLAVNGDLDCQVLPCNLDAIAAATDGRAVVKLMPGLNHLLQHCTSGSTAEYFQIDETLAPEVLALVAQWILERVK